MQGKWSRIERRVDSRIERRVESRVDNSCFPLSRGASVNVRWVLDTM